MSAASGRGAVDGAGTDEHRRAVTSGMARARQLRETWTRSVATGEVTFAALVELSKLDDEHRYLSKIRLVDILETRTGWTRATALTTLDRVGFDSRDTVQSIRRSPTKIGLFAEVLVSRTDRWRARPEPPAGWPWAGKLTALLAAAGSRVKLPDELTALLDPDDDDAEVDDQAPVPNADPAATVTGDELDDLLGDDEDDAYSRLLDDEDDG